MTGAAYHTGKSKQDICTPINFLNAVEERFGDIKWDLAATFENNVVMREDENGYYFGPDSCWSMDSLKIDWYSQIPVESRSTWWLNPPFGNITPWAKKCAECRYYSNWTLLIVPYSAGANWWRNYVRDKAMVFALQPRLKFIGSKDPYPKDLALCAYGFGVRGEDNWRWK